MTLSLTIRTLALLALAVALLACGGNGQTGASPAAGSPAAASPDQAGPTPDVPPTPSPGVGGQGEPVDIFDFGYNPATVEISAGTTVLWTNTGDAPHTVTFEEDGMDSGSIPAGESFERAFDQPGEYSYLCTIHPTMTGKVNVSP